MLKFLPAEQVHSDGTHGGIPMSESRHRWKLASIDGIAPETGMAAARLWSFCIQRFWPIVQWRYGQSSGEWIRL